MTYKILINYKLMNTEKIGKLFGKSFFTFRML